VRKILKIRVYGKTRTGVDRCVIKFDRLPEGFMRSTNCLLFRMEGVRGCKLYFLEELLLLSTATLGFALLQNER
jgi:hypothetical protein